MSYALQLSIISRKPNQTARITSVDLTDPVSNEIRAVFNAITRPFPELRSDLEAIYSSNDGRQIPVPAFRCMDFDETLSRINGVDVNGSTFRMTASACAEIQDRLSAGSEVELFLSLD